MRTGSRAHDAIWHLLEDDDPVELVEQRTKMLVQLARYCHAASPGPLMGWDEVELSDFRRQYEALAEILKGESPTQAVAEQ